MFREIEKYSGYLIFSTGEIFSIKRNNFLVGKTDKYGYRVVLLTLESKKVHKTVHRLVAEAFLGFSSLQVNHKDGNKQNNCLENLEYVTAKENTEHAFKLGLRKSCPKGIRTNSNGFGEGNGTSILKEDQVIAIKKLLKEKILTQKKIADTFSVSESCIKMIAQGRSWKHLA